MSHYSMHFIKIMILLHVNELLFFCKFHLNSRHIQSNNQPPQPPVPPLGYVSGALISDLETDVPDDDADDEEEALEIPRPLRALDQTPGSSMDNLDSSVTGNGTNLIGITDLLVTLKCIKNQLLPYCKIYSTPSISVTFQIC